MTYRRRNVMVDRRLPLTLLLVACLTMSHAVPATAAETQPGDACTTADLHRQIGGPENPGTGFHLVCDGSTWKAITTWDTATGRMVFQVNNDTGSCISTKLGRIRYNGTSTWEYCNGSSWTSWSGGATLNGIAAATATNTINNGAYTQTWNWQLSGAGNGMTFTESTASTGGAGDQALVTMYSIASSTATPLWVINQGGAAAFRVDDSNPGDTTPFIIDSDGNVGIGKTNPGVTLDVVGDINYTGVIVDLSDRRMKENIKHLGVESLGKITSLQGVSFTMKDDKEAKPELGFIAQDVEPVFAELVHTTSEGTKSMNYIGLIAPMVEAIKEQQREIVRLNARIDALTQTTGGQGEERRVAPLPVRSRYND